MSDDVEMINEDDLIETVAVEELEESDTFDELDEFEESGQPEAVVGIEVERPTATGDPRVDDAIARLDDLDHAPTADHVAIVDDAHRRLQSALGDLDASAHGGP